MPRDRPADPFADRRAAYAQALAERGDFAAAADLMGQALALDPGWHAGAMRRAEWLERAGDRDGALSECARVLALDAVDPFGAGLRLTALGARAVPPAPPPAFVAALFDGYADRFEDALVGRLDYRAPDLLLAAIREAAGADVRFGSALDLGCGTGLMGARLRPLCARLVGIDLSAGMLAKARAGGLYDALHAGNILDLDLGLDRFDLATAADVFNYLGDLAPVLARAARWIDAGGRLAFTVETHDGPEPFVLRESLRYAHSPAAVSACLLDAGFTIEIERAAILRKDRGEPVAGTLFVAWKHAGHATARSIGLDRGVAANDWA